VTQKPAYDGLADEYEAFRSLQREYYRPAEEALRALLGSGPGRCVDVGCGAGHFVGVVRALGWRVVGVDESADQLRLARLREPDAELIVADASALPFTDASFDAGYSTFTHTDFDDFRGVMNETIRVLKPGARFVYVGNHPCFVGATQERGERGIPILHAGYRRSGRVDSSTVPGTTPGGWRARLGSFVHVPLEDFLNAFGGLTLERCEELDHGGEYPTAIALAFTKP
jgi:SAM-dependent methyltransferase